MLQFILLFLIILLGAITSFEDMRKGVIRNKWLILAIIATIATLVLFRAYSLIGIFFLSLASGLAFGVVLWKAGIWGAADAKLAGVYAAIISAIIAENFLVIFYLLTSTFLIYSVFLLRMSLVKELRLEGITARSVAEACLVIFGLSWLVKNILLLFSIEPHFFLIFSVIFIISLIMNKFFSSLLIPSIVMAIFRIYFENASLFSISFLTGFLAMLILFVLLRTLATASYHAFSATVLIADLKEGDMPAENIYFDPAKKKYCKAQKSLWTKKKMLLGEDLTARQLRKLKQLNQKGLLDFDSLRIHNSVPLAPMLFLGALVTLAGHYLP